MGRRIMKKHALKFVFRKGHPCWRAVLNKLGAEFIQIKGPDTNLKIRAIFYKFQVPITITSSFLKALFTNRNDSNRYIISGIQPIWFPLFMKWIKREKNRIILIANDASFNIDNKSFLSRKMHKFFFNKLDGIIAISPMIVAMTKKHVNCPVKYVIDPIWRGYAYFNINKPDFEHNNFIHVGKFQLIKGIDITGKVLDILMKQNSNINSFILGDDMKKGFAKLGVKNKNFVFPGYVDPMRYFNKSKYYIQTGRLEAGGTAVLEAMAAGLVPFVTTTVGHSNIVQEVDRRLVIDSLKPKVIAKKIAQFMNNVTDAELKRISAKCKKITEQNDLDKITKRFEKAADSILAGSTL